MNNRLIPNPTSRARRRGRLLTGALVALALVAALGAGACGDSEDNGDGAAAPAITVEEAWARNAPAQPGGMGSGGGMGATVTPGERGAAYMVIRNAGAADDALTGASSGVAEATEVHESRMDGETVTMQKVDRIAVPAEGSVELKPGGFHVMFIGLKRKLTAGDTVEITLHFQNAGDVQVRATVRDA